MKVVHICRLLLSEAQRDALAAAVEFAYGDDEDAVLRDRDIDPPTVHALRALLPVKASTSQPSDPVEPLDLSDHGRRSSLGRSD